MKPAPERVDVNATETKDIITRTKIEQLGTTTDFLYTLSDLPNTVVWDGGGNTVSGAKISLNGFDYTRINFQLDGIPLNDSDSYSFYSQEFAQNDIIKSLVVTPGAGNAAVVGLSAIGGNIELNTDDPDHDFYLQPRLGAGSYNKYEQAGKVSSGTFLQGIAPTSFYAAVTHVSAQSFFQNNSASKTNVAFKSNTKLFGGTLTTFFAQNNQIFAYYEGCTQANINTYGDSCNFYNNTPSSKNFTGLNYNRYLDWIGYIDYTLPIGPAKLDNKYYYYEGHGYGANGANVGTAKTLVLEPSYNLTHRWGDIIKATIPLGHGLTLEPGGWFQMNRTEHYEANQSIATSQEVTPRVYDEFVRTLTSTPYVNLSGKPVERLAFDLGVKYLLLDRDYYAPAPTQNPPEYYTTQFRKLLPSVGVNYEFLTGWHAYANYTRNLRPPGYSEFYTGNFAYNSGLKAEATHNYATGVYLDKGPFEGRVTAFYTSYQNYILNFSVPNPTGGSGSVTEVINVGDAHYGGAAVTMTWLMTPWLQSFLNLGVLKTWIDGYGSGAAPYAPNQTQSIGLFANYHGFSTTLSVDHAGQRAYLFTDPFGGKNPVQYLGLPSMVTANASVGYDWKPRTTWLKELDTHLALRNVGNNRAVIDYNVGSFNSFNPNDPLLVLNPPFSVFLTVDAKLF